MFTFKDVGYKADLCAKHQQDFENAISSFLHLAEPTTARVGTAMRKAMRGQKGSFTTKEVRDWALAQGRDVAPSGRLPNALIEDFKQAQRG